MRLYILAFAGLFSAPAFADVTCTTYVVSAGHEAPSSISTIPSNGAISAEVNCSGYKTLVQIVTSEQECAGINFKASVTSK